MKLLLVAAMTTLGAAASGCAKEDAVPTTTPAKPEASPEEAMAIAEEAYIYAFPMLESYKRLYSQAIDRTDPSYLGAFNTVFTKDPERLSERSDTRLRTDTLRSVAWLDLRAQPLVLTVPPVKDRYYSVQLIDMFSQSFAYVGAGTTGNDAGSYVVAGPLWEGTEPERANAVLRSESNFAYCIIRIEVENVEDLAAATTVQKGFVLSTLSGFLGAGEGPDAAGITFPAYHTKRAESAAFIDLFNFLLTEVAVPRGEGALMTKFGRIGIEPGALSASLGLSRNRRSALDAGVGQAFGKMVAAAQNLSVLDGVTVRSSKEWQGVDGLFGQGRRSPADYLRRAVAAKLGFGESASREVYRVATREDASGEPLDGVTHDYLLRFRDRELPSVEAFWSVAVYSPPNQRVVGRPADVYAVLDRSEVRYAKDGSLTLYIQRESPGAKRVGNWLPAPPGPFSLEVSLYAPKPEASSPLYLPPPVERVH